MLDLDQVFSHISPVKPTISYNYRLIFIGVHFQKPAGLTLVNSNDVPGVMSEAI